MTKNSLYFATVPRSGAKKITQKSRSELEHSWFFASFGLVLSLSKYQEKMKINV